MGTVARSLLLAAMTAVSATGKASAQSAPSLDTGNGLLDSCSSESGSFKHGLCYGYIAGHVSTINRIAYCIPPEVTHRQEYDIVVKGLQDHPEERQKGSVYLVMKYLNAAFPCAKQ